MNKLLKTKDAAEILGLTEDTVRRLARAGKLPGHRVGRSWRFFKSAIDSRIWRAKKAAQPWKMPTAEEMAELRDWSNRATEALFRREP